MEARILEIRNRNKEIPDWAQSFLSTFYSTQKVEHEAAINVKNLPKVVWNDNTFYVALDAEEGNADILNEYGNVITALKNVASIDDVENQLNKHIVAEVSDSFKLGNVKHTKSLTSMDMSDIELAKVANAINLDFPFNEKDSLNENSLNEKNSLNENNSLNKEASTEEDAAANFTNSTNNMATNTRVSTAPTTPDTSANVSTSTMQTTDPSINQSLNSAANMPQQTNSVADQMDSAAMSAQANFIKKMRIQLANTTKSLKHQQVQTNKLQQEFNLYKKETEKTITKLARLVNSLQDQMHAYINPGNIYDVNCNEAELQHYSQTAAESAKAISVEHAVDLTTPGGRVSLKDRILQDLGNMYIPSPLEESIAPSTNKNDDNNNEIEVTIIQSDDDDNSDKNIDKNRNIDVEIVDANDFVNNKQVLNLNDNDSSVFKTQTCPMCNGKKSLCLSDKTASVQNVICKKCNTKFGVNLNNEQIFKYL